jgi:hypothetical protein
MKPGRELIARKAYELWLQKGGSNGHDQDHWYEAEKSLEAA